MVSDGSLSVQRKVNRRASLVGGFSAALAASLGAAPSGLLHREIDTQRVSAAWNRATTPLEAGWYSMLQHVGAATGHTNAFLRSLGEPRHVATMALLARGVLESLAVAAWLQDDHASVTERSLRALSEVRYSTNELKKLYRDQGFRVDLPDLDSRGTTIEGAIADIERDGKVAGGEVGPRPGFTDLIDNHLLGLEKRHGNMPSDAGPIYRYLSPLAHGTKWAMNHYATPIVGTDLVSTSPTPEFVEMLLFYLGVALLKVGSLATRRLAWLDLTDHGAREFISLGPCDVDVGS